ncbi:MAG TPA: hypothetical protein VLL96_04870 [Candidatus Deferrimicrobiaceae bacterium]|nr:hypothetical protein [Candidatus Deferrimicrobiaceae bacterium]
MSVLVDLDPVGNVSLVFQIIIVFLLLIGLPLLRRKKGSVNNKNLIRHGYFTTIALILHSVLIISVMVPGFTEGLLELGELSTFSSAMFWSHIVLGTTAEIIGIVIVGLWLGRGASKLTCFKHKKWMTPLLVIWIISIINGALIHLLGLM